MIVVKLKGGLGNQLFQYGMARHLSERHGVPFCLDRRDYRKSFRSYDLDRWQVKEKVGGHLWKRWLPMVEERRRFEFDEELVANTARGYLDGYWQAAKYVEPIEELLRRELKLKRPVKGKMPEGESVCVHVRRGDYRTVERVREAHGMCSILYFNWCAEEIAMEVEKEPHFYVFSDEPEVVKRELELPGETTWMEVGNSWEDMWRMGQCKHHIISNSSFSWWGAWLGESEEQIVYAPEEWMVGESSEEIVPKRWRRVRDTWGAIGCGG